MKLFEIVNVKDNPNLEQPDAEQEIGSGHYAKVANDPKDPHMVRKSTPTDDPYNLYLDWLINNDAMSNNPYFPRVYEQNSANGQRVLQMEKLREFKTMNSRELETLIQRLYGGEVSLADMKQGYMDRFSWKKDLSDIESKLDKSPSIAVADYIRNSVKGGEFRDEVKDPMFSKALSIVRSLAMNHSKTVDLHSGNFMIRRGPTGPQLVIIDPLS